MELNAQQIRWLDHTVPQMLKSSDNYHKNTGKELYALTKFKVKPDPCIPLVHHPLTEKDKFGNTWCVDEFSLALYKSFTKRFGAPSERQWLDVESLLDRHYADFCPLSTELLNIMGGDVQKEMVKGIMKRHSYGYIAAQPKSAKSWVALESCVSVATGTPFMGSDLFPVEEPGEVALFYPEGVGGLKSRLDMLFQARGYKGFIDKDPDLFPGAIFPFTQHLDFRDDKTLAQFSRVMEKCQPKLIMIDSLYRYIGNFNLMNYSEVTEILSSVQNAAQSACDAAFWVSAHFKRGARGEAELSDVAGPGFELWANDWILIDAKSDLGARPIRLKLSVGGRDWQSLYKSIDVEMTDGLWSVGPSTLYAGDATKPLDARSRIAADMLAYITSNAAGVSAAAVKAAVKGRAELKGQVWKDLLGNGAVVKRDGLFFLAVSPIPVSHP